MRIVFIFLFFVASVISKAQNPFLTDIKNEIKIDSLVDFVENISGEKGVIVNGNLDTIYSRHKSKPGNELAFDYIIQEFERFGLQSDSMIFSATGKNALAIQSGSVYPDKYYILCAHYDDMPNLPIAPAADDDGSGVAAVLEAARVLSKYQFEYTIIYAIWDEEEQGLVGSTAYAQLAAANGDSLLGVINMDAIAWDGDSDDHAMIHVRPIGNSLRISDTIQSMNSTFGLNVILAITNPGATYSDHASFWNNNFGAVLVIEDWTFDPNPYYHTDQDLLAYFNLPYYEKMAKLSLLSIAALANPIGWMSVHTEMKLDLIHVFPNPVNDFLNIDLSKIQSNESTLFIYDLQGKLLLDKTISGMNFVSLDLQLLNSGIYFLELFSGEEIYRTKFMK